MKRGILTTVMVFILVMTTWGIDLNDYIQCPDNQRLWYNYTNEHNTYKWVFEYNQSSSNDDHYVTEVRELGYSKLRLLHNYVVANYTGPQMIIKETVSMSNGNEMIEHDPPIVEIILDTPIEVGHKWETNGVQREIMEIRDNVEVFLLQQEGPYRSGTTLKLDDVIYIKVSPIQPSGRVEKHELYAPGYGLLVEQSDKYEIVLWLEG